MSMRSGASASHGNNECTPRVNGNYNHDFTTNSSSFSKESSGQASDYSTWLERKLDKMEADEKKNLAQLDELVAIIEKCTADSSVATTSSWVNSGNPGVDSRGRLMVAVMKSTQTIKALRAELRKSKKEAEETAAALAEITKKKGLLSLASEQSGAKSEDYYVRELQLALSTAVDGSSTAGPFKGEEAFVDDVSKQLLDSLGSPSHSTRAPDLISLDNSTGVYSGPASEDGSDSVNSDNFQMPESPGPLYSTPTRSSVSGRQSDQTGRSRRRIALQAKVDLKECEHSVADLWKSAVGVLRECMGPGAQVRSLRARRGSTREDIKNRVDAYIEGVSNVLQSMGKELQSRQRDRVELESKGSDPTSDLASPRGHETHSVQTSPAISGNSSPGEVAVQRHIRKAIHLVEDENVRLKSQVASLELSLREAELEIKEMCVDEKDRNMKAEEDTATRVHLEAMCSSLTAALEKEKIARAHAEMQVRQLETGLSEKFKSHLQERLLELENSRDELRSRVTALQDSLALEAREADKCRSAAFKLWAEKHV